MADPTLPVRRAVQHLAERTAMRAEIVLLRRQLADERLTSDRLRLVLAFSCLARTAPPLPPLRVLPVRIPAPRVSPEGLPRATSPRPLRRRPR